MIGHQIKALPPEKIDSTLREMTAKLSERSKHLPVVGGPFVVTGEVPSAGLSVEEFADKFCLNENSPTLKIDVTEKLHPGLPLEHVVWMVQHPSGAWQSAPAVTKEEDGRITVELSDLLTLLDPDADMKEMPRENLKFEINLVALRVD